MVSRVRHNSPTTTAMAELSSDWSRTPPPPSRSVQTYMHVSMWKRKKMTGVYLQANSKAGLNSELIICKLIHTCVLVTESLQGRVVLSCNTLYAVHHLPTPLVRHPEQHLRHIPGSTLFFCVNSSGYLPYVSAQVRRDEVVHDMLGHTLPGPPVPESSGQLSLPV